MKSRRAKKTKPSPEPVAKRAGLKRCFVCKQWKHLKDFEVPPGKPRAKICTACLDAGKLRFFLRPCLEGGPKCLHTFESTSPRANTCDHCKPIRRARLSAERSKKHRAKKGAQPRERS